MPVLEGIDVCSCKDRAIQKMRPVLKCGGSSDAAYQSMHLIKVMKL